MSTPQMKKISLFLHYIILIIICQVLALFGLPSTPTFASTDANDFYFDDFTADYYLSKDDDGHSRLRVVENFTAIFPEIDQNHGITRIIPFTNQDGKNLTMPIDNELKITIKHNGIIEEPYKINTGDGYYEVFIGSPYEFAHGRQIYTLEYEFENVITDFSQDGSSWQELYWDTNGNDWSQRFNSLTARLHFSDPEIANHYTSNVSCYVGIYGANDQRRCNIRQNENEIEFQAKNLAAGENLTFAVTFDLGTFSGTKLHYNYRLIIALGVEFVLVILSIIIVCYGWSKVSSKHKYYKNLFIKPEYTPLRSYSVSEMTKNHIGSGLTPQSTIVTATVLDLAVNHKLEIIKIDPDAFGHVWKIRLKSSKFTDEERTVLKLIDPSLMEIKTGTEFTINEGAPYELYSNLLRQFERETIQNLRQKGLFEPKPAQKSKFWTPTNLLIFITIIWLGLGLLVWPFLLSDIHSYDNLIGGWQLWVGILIIGVVNFIGLIIIEIIIDRYIERTNKGIEISRYMDGLKQYIKLAEAERIQFLQSATNAELTHENIVKLYEKLLPYAIIFGYEKTWVDELAKYYEFDDVPAPNWYTGTVGAFAIRDFTNTVSEISQTISASAISHSSTSSSSSSSSGSSGGGFSGGGGGGGGGGGW